MANKQQVKASYIARLQAKYPFYVEGSRPLKLANEAADAALAGRMKLEGEAWSEALADCGLPARITMKALAALPEGEG